MNIQKMYIKFLHIPQSSKKKQIKHDWSKLIIDENVKTAYIVDVKNMFKQLQVDVLDKSSDLTYNNMIKAHNKAAELQNEHGQREDFYG